MKSKHQVFEELKDNRKNLGPIGREVTDFLMDGMRVSEIARRCDERCEHNE